MPGSGCWTNLHDRTTRLASTVATMTTLPTDADHAATSYLDHDHPRVRDFARDTTRGLTDDAERAAALFAAVRDQIRYDPYALELRPEAMRASAVLDSGRTWCVPKATLLAAAARAVGIPARLGFADVRNHLSTPRLLEVMGTDVFRWHGYTTLFVDGTWRKASPAFDAALCARFGVQPLAFDGRSDALLHAYAAHGERYMEYLVDHGDFADLPLARIVAELHAAHPQMVTRAATTQDAGSRPQP